MEAGDYVVLEDEIEIGPEFSRCGLIIRKIKSYGKMVITFEVLFTDGVIENYHQQEIREISDKDYFRLQLGARLV